jgi:hypothetical protein
VVGGDPVALLPETNKETAMFEEIVSKMQPSDLTLVLAIVVGIVAGVAVAITAIITGSARRYRERELAANLIHELLERNLPTDEIERLVHAIAPESEAERLIRAAAARKSQVSEKC